MRFIRSSILLLLFCAILNLHGNFAFANTVDEQWMKSVREFESSIGQRVSLPEWLPIQDPVINAELQPNFKRLLITYSSKEKINDKIKLYITMNNHVIQPVHVYKQHSLRNGVVGYYKNHEEGQKKLPVKFTTLHFNYKDSHYMLFDFSGSESSESNLIKIANSIIG